MFMLSVGTNVCCFNPASRHSCFGKKSVTKNHNKGRNFCLKRDLHGGDLKESLQSEDSRFDPQPSTFLPSMVCL